jgi:hypothetical protein
MSHDTADRTYQSKLPLVFVDDSPDQGLAIDSRTGRTVRGNLSPRRRVRLKVLGLMGFGVQFHEAHGSGGDAHVDLDRAREVFAGVVQKNSLKLLKRNLDLVRDGVHGLILPEMKRKS